MPSRSDTGPIEVIPVEGEQTWPGFKNRPDLEEVMGSDTEATAKVTLYHCRECGERIGRELWESPCPNGHEIEVLGIGGDIDRREYVAATELERVTSERDRWATNAERLHADLEDEHRRLLSLEAERDRLAEALRHPSNYHWGPNGQECRCEDCTMKREALNGGESE